ncbi:MAG: hypothetical protein AB7J46_06420 [Candidatus Altimarinota bacterium]
MSQTTSDLIIRSINGMNNSDAAIALPEDICVLAQNVEWIDSELGERRKGSDAIDLTGAAVASRDKIVGAFRHLPTTDETAAELWLVGLTGTTTLSVSKKTSSWADVTVSDTPLKTGFAPYRWQALSLHGKFFLAYDSDQDRLHVWDGTNMRRCGLAEPAAPTAADAGSASLDGTRYYRVRYTVQSGGSTILRSEPSDSLTFTPSGSGASVTVTKPASISEGETHWELEASNDNTNFYRIATTAVGTTTYSDTVDTSTSRYADVSGAVLSEDIGDYSLIPSARYLTADEDRLIFAGSWETSSQASRVGWTPVNNADGVGNDERMESDTDPTLDLDGYDGGVITGISAPTLGSIWVFKERHIYKLIRRGKRSTAYEAIKISDSIGAIHGSVVNGMDLMGRPVVYFIDPQIGPCFIGGPDGLQHCGHNIDATWQTINLDATQVPCTGVYYPKNKQLHYWLATGSSNTPDTHIVLHTEIMRQDDEGYSKGWAVWTGPTASALCAVMFSDNIDDDTTRSRDLVPFIGLSGSGLCHRLDTGNDDNGTAYSAKIVTKPYMLRNILHKFGTRAAILLAKAVANAVIDLKIRRDFEAETVTVQTEIPMDATLDETQVFKQFDDFSMADARVIQVEFADPATPSTARWELNQFVMGGRREQTG